MCPCRQTATGLRLYPKSLCTPYIRALHHGGSTDFYTLCRPLCVPEGVIRNSASGSVCDGIYQRGRKKRELSFISSSESDLSQHKLSEVTRSFPFSFNSDFLSSLRVSDSLVFVGVYSKVARHVLSVENGNDMIHRKQKVYQDSGT